MLKFLAAFLDLIGKFFDYLERKGKAREAADSPDEVAKRKKAEIEKAIAEDNIDIINATFNDMRKARNKDSNTPL